MTIIFLMAGKGRRFIREGYEPRNTLPLWGSTVFAHVVGSFQNRFDSDDFVFVVPDQISKAFIENQATALRISSVRTVVVPNSQNLFSSVLAGLMVAPDIDKPVIISAGPIRTHFTISEPSKSFIEILPSMQGTGVCYFPNGRILKDTYKSLDAEGFLKGADSFTIGRRLINELVKCGTPVHVKFVSERDVFRCDNPAQYRRLCRRRMPKALKPNQPG